MDLDVVGSNPITRPIYHKKSPAERTAGALGCGLGSKASQELNGTAVSDERADLIVNMLREIRGKQDQHDQKSEKWLRGLAQSSEISPG